MEQKNTYKAVSFTKGSLVSTIVGLVQAAILIAVGITCIACCNQAWLTKGIFLAVGILVTLFGLAKLIMNAAPVFLAGRLSEEEKTLFKGNFSTDMIMTGAIELIVGILLIVLYAVSDGTLLTSLMAFLGYTLAIALFVIASTILVFATGFLVSKIYKVFAAVVYYVIAAILIGLGVMICIFLSNGSDFTIVVLVAAGVILCCIGLVGLVITIKDAIVAKKDKKEKEANAPVEAVEVKVVEVETKNEIVEK